MVRQHTLTPVDARRDGLLTPTLFTAFLWTVVAGLLVKAFIYSRTAPGAQPIGAPLSLFSTMWVLVGLAAMRRLADRLLARQDITFTAGEVEVRSRLGPLSSRVRLERAEVLDFFVQETVGVLYARTRGRRVKLVWLGTPKQLSDLQGDLRRVFDLGPPARVWLPAGFIKRDEVGRTVLERERAGRLVLGGFGVALLGLGLVTAHAQPGLLVLSALGAFLLGAAFVRRQWLLGPGVLGTRWRFGPWSGARPHRVTELNLTRSTDSDGDHWYTLDAVGPDGTVKLESALNDAEPGAALGEYVATLLALPLNYGEGCEALRPSSRSAPPASESTQR
jgi:hypothetical protein